MEDLEKRVNEAIRLLSPISVYRPTETHTITGDQMDLLRGLICEQQAEINRLKSKQVRLRPMEELKKTPFKDALCLDIRKYSPPTFEVACYWSGEGEERFRNEYTNLENPIGWIALSDLPRKMEE